MALYRWADVLVSTEAQDTNLKSCWRTFVPLDHCCHLGKNELFTHEFEQNTSIFISDLRHFRQHLGFLCCKMKVIYFLKSMRKNIIAIVLLIYACVEGLAAV